VNVFATGGNKRPSSPRSERKEVSLTKRASTGITKGGQEGAAVLFQIALDSSVVKLGEGGGGDEGIRLRIGGVSH